MGLGLEGDTWPELDLSGLVWAASFDLSGSPLITWNGLGLLGP